MLFTNPDFFYDEPLDILKHPATVGASEMSQWEQSFLCGLIRKHRPKKLLEVGVSAGGTTAVILRCLEALGMTDSTLWSVDLLPYYYLKPEKPAGYVASEVMPQMMHQWRLKTGGHVARWLPEIGDDIDFVVLDTAHILPGELLDFICILPSLKMGAIVVLHDLQLYELAPSAAQDIATHLLLQTVVADKILCEDTVRWGTYPNIGAFQVSEDTVRHQDALFYALNMIWSYIPDYSQRSDILQWVGQRYALPYVERLRWALRSQSRAFFPVDRYPLLHALSGTLVVWGAGFLGTRLLFCLDHLDPGPLQPLTTILVDANPIKQGQILEGRCVQDPIVVLTGPDRPAHVVVCVQNSDAQQRIFEQLAAWGYIQGETASLYTDYLTV